MPISDQRLDRAEAKVEKLQVNVGKVEQDLAVHETECEGRHTAIALKLTQIDEALVRISRKSDEQSAAVQLGFQTTTRFFVWGFLLIIALTLGFQSKPGEFILHLIGLL